jgi:hypothetical protein
MPCCTATCWTGTEICTGLVSGCTCESL